jgi:hypothetical protein
VSRRFSRPFLAALQQHNHILTRAGAGPHRFIGIWFVVVEGRVFVRSWSRKQRSWYRTFLEDPTGALQVASVEKRIRARRVRSERLLLAVDRAYAERYATPSARHYVRDMSRGPSRASTTELVPA